MSKEYETMTKHFTKKDHKWQEAPGKMLNIIDLQIKPQ
jgi:hypothetical protein